MSAYLRHVALLYVALRSGYCLALNTRNFSKFRLLVFCWNWLSILLMLVYMGTMIVILLNILKARPTFRQIKLPVWSMMWMVFHSSLDIANDWPETLKNGKKLAEWRWRRGWSFPFNCFQITFTDKRKKVFKWLHPTVLRWMQSKCSTFSQSF